MIIVILPVYPDWQWVAAQSNTVACEEANGRYGYERSELGLEVREARVL